ncbi:hypothetical protein Tco_1483271 [Tanacetum coccineum]
MNGDDGCGGGGRWKMEDGVISIGIQWKNSVKSQKQERIEGSSDEGSGSVGPIRRIQVSGQSCFSHKMQTVRS